MTSYSYLVALRRSWAILLVAVILGVGAGYVGSAFATPVYTANAKLYFSIGAGTSGTDLNQGSTYVQAQMLSYAELATSPIVLGPVVDSLGLETSPAALAGTIDATTPQGTALLEISANAPNAEQAAHVANAVAESLSSEIDRLVPVSTNSKKALAVTLVMPASAPLSQSAPDTSRNILAGIVLGLIVGVLIMVLRQRIESRVEGAAALAELTNAPLLASIGRRYRGPASGSDDVHAMLVTEADRQLGAALLSAMVDSQHFSVLMTSSVPLEGTSVTALGLALALGERRSRVLLIEGNLRRPTIAHRTGLSAGPGLSDILAGSDSAESAVQVNESAGIDVLVAGAVSGDPSALLSSQAFATLIATAERDYDVVIIDVAPITVTADAMIIGPHVSGAIVIADSTRVRGAKLVSALDSLTAARIPIIGVVLNNVRTHVPHYENAVPPVIVRAPAAAAFVGGDVEREIPTAGGN